MLCLTWFRIWLRCICDRSAWSAAFTSISSVFAAFHLHKSKKDFQLRSDVNDFSKICTRLLDCHHSQAGWAIPRFEHIPSDLSRVNNPPAWINCTALENMRVHICVCILTCGAIEKARLIKYITSNAACDVTVQLPVLWFQYSVCSDSTANDMRDDPNAQ